MELLEDQGKSKKKEAQQKKITRKSNHFNDAVQCAVSTGTHFTH